MVPPPPPFYPAPLPPAGLASEAPLEDFRGVNYGGVLLQRRQMLNDPRTMIKRFIMIKIPSAPGRGGWRQII